MNKEIIDNFNFVVEQIKNSEPNKGNLSNDTKLQFYSLYKQATVGKCNIPQPWAVQFEERAKWDAWNKLGNMSKETAMLNYCDIYMSFFN